MRKGCDLNLLKPGWRIEKLKQSITEGDGRVRGIRGLTMQTGRETMSEISDCFTTRTKVKDGKLRLFQIFVNCCVIGDRLDTVCSG